MSTEYNAKWFNDNGNHTHAITYPLNEDSIVVDLGGYHGVWASQILEKYNCNMFLFEPIPEFYHYLVSKFKNNPKVKVFNVGVSTKNCQDIFHQRGDGTSKYIVNGVAIPVELVSIEDIFKIIGHDKIDLIQVNIEGEEYPVLEKLLETGSINKLSYIQIQFHTFVENAEQKRQDIQNKLSKTFTKIYDYPFVFEGWKLN